MFVRKTFQFRLRPTKSQAKLLQVQLNECRWLYNELLLQRKLAYEELDISLSKYQQLMLLPLLKEERPALKTVHSQVLQNIVDRLDKAFQSFFRRCKAGEKPGFPRFRAEPRYDSFCYPQSGFALCGKEIYLSKIGRMRFKIHRPVVGDIKTCTIKKTASGEWDISLSCEVKAMPLEPKAEAIAVDVGIESFATLSDGKKIANPRFFKKAEKALAKAQHQYICLEDLNIRKMMSGSHFAKSIADASWNQFHQFLTYKAAEAGRKLGLVNPAYTSQVCSRCGHLEPKELREREHRCCQCGYTAHRDFNAAQNILALGLDGLGVIPRSSCL